MARRPAHRNVAVLGVPGDDRELRTAIEEPEGAAWISALALDDHGHLITGYQDGTLKILDARTSAR